MRLWHIALVTAAALCGCGGGQLVEVSDVLSGQLLVLKSGERVMLDGVTAPAEGEQGFRESRDLLHRVVNGRKLRIARKGEAADGSTVADIYLEELSVGRMMLALNAAKPAKTPRRKK